MVRFRSYFEEAKHQGSLWNPLTLSPDVFLNPCDCGSVLLGSSNIVASIKNSGRLRGIFSAPTTASGQEFRLVERYGSTWINNPVANLGFLSSFTANIIYSAVQFHSCIALYIPLGSGVVSGIGSNGTGGGQTHFAAISFGSESRDFSVYITGTVGFSTNAAMTPLPPVRPTIVSTVNSSNNFLGRFSQGTPSATAQSTDLTAKAGAGRTGNLRAWGRGTAAPVNTGMFGPVILFARRLPISDILKCEGWMAWQAGVPFCLAPDHPYKSYPPTI